MQERSKYLGLSFISHDQSAEVLQPGDDPFDFPASSITSEVSAVLEF